MPLRMARATSSLRGRVRARLERPGLGPSGERRFSIASYIVVGLFAVGWLGAIVETARAGTPGEPIAPLMRSLTADPLARTSAPPTAFLVDAALKAIGGT